MLVLRQSCVFQPVFGEALFDLTKDGASIAVKVLRENAGRVAVKPFLVPILFTVNAERNGAGVNRLAGVLKVTHVSLLQNAEVHPLRDAWHQYPRPVCSMLFLIHKSLLYASVLVERAVFPAARPVISKHASSRMS